MKILYIFLFLIVTNCMYAINKISVEIKPDCIDDKQCVISVIVSNITNNILQVDPLSLPYSASYENNFFKLTNSATKQKIEYIGKYMKMREFQRDQYLLLHPGKPLAFKVNLCSLYDIEKASNIVIVYDFLSRYYTKDSDETQTQHLKSNILEIKIH